MYFLSYLFFYLQTYSLPGVSMTRAFSNRGVLSPLQRLAFPSIVHISRSGFTVQGSGFDIGKRLSQHLERKKQVYLESNDYKNQIEGKAQGVIGGREERWKKDKKEDKLQICT